MLIGIWGEFTAGVPDWKATQITLSKVEAFGKNVEILTYENLSQLVRLVNEEMDAAADEYRERLDGITVELDNVNRRLERLYDAVVIGEETYQDRPCWIVELNAKIPDASYQMRKTWVDKKRYVPLKEELYAKSGKLLKRTELFDFKRVDNRWFPDRMVFKDMLKKGEGTEFIIVSIEFDTNIPEHLLTKAALR